MLGCLLEFTAQEGPNRIGPGRTLLHTNPKKIKNPNQLATLLSYNPVDLVPTWNLAYVTQI